MAMAYATVTGRIVIPGTTTGIPGELRATPLTEGGVLSFPTEDYTTIGYAVADVAADGTLTPSLQIPTDVPDGTVWRLVFHPKGKGNLPVRLGDYEIPASADLADLVEVQVQAITPTVAADIAGAGAAATSAAASASAAAASAALADSYIVEDLATSDGQMEALIASPTSLTGAALSATIAAGKAFYDVRDYGAVGNGSADDTAAIQAAITAAAGAEVIVARGTYLTGTLTSSTGLNLTLAEGATLKLKNATNTSLVSVTGGTRVRIKGGTFDGNKANNSSGTAGLISVSGVAEVDVDTRIATSGGSGVRVAGASRGLLTPVVLDVAGHGVQIVDSSNVTIRATVEGTDQTGVSVVPATVDCANIVVEGVYRNVARLGAPHMGIYFNSGDSFVVKRSRVSATVENAGYIGIFPGGDHNSVTGWTIDGAGTVTAAGGHGVWVHDSAHIAIGPGVVRNSARAGVAVNKSHAVNVTGVTATRNGNAGFLVSRDAGATGRYQGDATNKDVTLSGCVATDNGQAAANVWPGFYLDGYKSVSVVACQAHDYQGTKTQARGLIAPTNASSADISIVGCDFKGNLSGVGLVVPAAYLSANYGNTPADAAFVATGAAQLAAGATDGFVYLPRINGTPTGTPTAKAGGWAAAYDKPGSKLWVHDGTVWKSVTLA